MVQKKKEHIILMTMYAGDPLIGKQHAINCHGISWAINAPGIMYAVTA